MNTKMLFSAFLSVAAVGACATSEQSANRDGRVASSRDVDQAPSTDHAGQHVAVDTDRTSAPVAVSTKGDGVSTKGDGVATKGDGVDTKETAQYERDNTGVNKRDRETDAVTPIDQGNNATDLEITQKIRQAVVGMDSLSFTAKNVKIVTVDGKVTLRGPVKSTKERAAIEKCAKEVAGAQRVDNQLEVES